MSTGSGGIHDLMWLLAVSLTFLLWSLPLHIAAKAIRDSRLSVWKWAKTLALMGVAWGCIFMFNLLLLAMFYSEGSNQGRQMKEAVFGVIAIAVLVIIHAALYRSWRAISPVASAPEAERDDAI
jgi:heme/copper-type cytochrome/quinol oxidase subunit 2